MDIASVILYWDQKLICLIEKIIQENDFPFFVRILCNKQQFWYACLWMSMMTGEYFNQHPNANLEEYFVKADKIIANMPDLFNDRLQMQAHGLLWQYGFKKFFNNIHYVVEIAKLLDSNELKHQN